MSKKRELALKITGAAIFSVLWAASFGSAAAGPRRHKRRGRSIPPCPTRARPATP